MNDKSKLSETNPTWGNLILNLIFNKWLIPFESHLLKISKLQKLFQGILLPLRNLFPGLDMGTSAELLNLRLSKWHKSNGLHINQNVTKTI